MANWIGKVFRQFDDEAGHLKFHVIVADQAGDLATIYINTEARYTGLSSLLQASQLPITPDTCQFLDHDSFLDCSSIKECKKSEINEYLQRNRGHDCGYIADNLLTMAIGILKKSKTIEKFIKEKYGFNLH